MCIRDRSDAKGYYDYVTGKFDKLLAEHGYVREGHYYRVEKMCIRDRSYR